MERSESAYGHAWVALISAAIELTEGDSYAADQLLVPARQRAVAALGDDADVVATLDFVHARALLDMGRMEAARDRALRGLARVAQHGSVETAVHGLCACVGLWLGEADGPFSLAALTALARSYPPRVQRLLAMMQVRRLLQLGRQEQALALASRHLLELNVADDVCPGEAGDRALIHLELLIARGGGGKALEQIDHWLKVFRSQQRLREVIELHLMSAELHVNGNQVRQAVRSLTLALLTVGGTRLVRPFYERLGMIGKILSQSRTKDFGFTQPSELALLEDLADACRAAGSHVPPPSAASPAAEGVSVNVEVGPLTPREMQLLELLELGLSNQLIADRIYVSLPTVKWHLYNLFAKLQVKTRAAALSRARALNLLSS